MSQKNKLRLIRQLKNGERKSMNEDTYNKYIWTEEEKKYLEDNDCVNKEDILLVPDVDDPNIVTKYEMFVYIELFNTNTFTIKNYKSRVNALLDLMNVQNNFNEVLNDIELLIDKIREKYKDPVAYYGFLLWCVSKCEKLKLIHNNTIDRLKIEFDTAKNYQVINQINERENGKMNYTSIYHSLFDKERELGKEKYGSISHVIALMYSRGLYDKDDIIHINPRNYYIEVKLRDDDYEFGENDDKFNYYNTKSGRLVIHNYKTGGIYDEYDVYVTTYVMKVIEKSIELKPREYLIEKDDGGLYSNNALSERITKVLNHNINTIRKAIESYEINVKNTSRECLAYVSRHSVSTQEMCYLSRN